MQASPARCRDCLFPPELCLCPEVPRLVSPVRFVVVRHVSERPRLSNTARWAALALPGTRVLDHGDPRRPLDVAALGEPGSVVLFPSAHPAAALGLPADRPRVVVVPDGTWGQARRMMQRVPALRGLPRLALAGPPAGLRLRRPHREDGMSTLEAMAGALVALGAADAAERLLALHARGVERVLRLRGTWGAAGEAARVHGRS